MVFHKILNNKTFSLIRGDSMRLLSIMFLAAFLVIAGCTTSPVEEDLFEEEPFEDSVIEQDPVPEEVHEEPVVEEEQIPEEVHEEPVVEEEVTEETTEGVDRVIEVEGGMYYFEPSVIEVEAGETIEFVFNNVQGMHDMWIPSLEAGTSVINSGQSESFIYTFDEAGTFDFLCTVGSHAAQGMVGEIIVS